jgi:hypothetical protein
MMFGIDAIITNHFKMFVRDMNDQTINKVDGRNAFGNGFVIFVSLIMKRDGVTVIRINSGSCNNRSPKISADIFNGDIRGAFVRFSSDIKAIGMLFVNLIFEFIEGRPKFMREFF